MGTDSLLNKTGSRHVRKYSNTKELSASSLKSTFIKTPVLFVIINIVSYILSNQEKWLFLYIREENRKEMGVR